MATEERPYRVLNREALQQILQMTGKEKAGKSEVRRSLALLQLSYFI